MIDSFYKWIREVFHLLIPGGIYFLDLIILLQCSSDFVFVDFLNDNKDYLIYIIILIITLFYLLGYTINLTVQCFIWLIKPVSEQRFKDGLDLEKTELMQHSGYYFSLIMIRHLIISFFILGPIFLICQFGNGIFEFNWIYIILWALYLIILSISYYQLQHKQKIINKFHNKQIKLLKLKTINSFRISVAIKGNKYARWHRKQNQVSRNQ